MSLYVAHAYWLWWQEINIQNMNVELVAQMFKNYQSNVLFHLEGMLVPVLAWEGSVRSQSLQPPMA